MKSQKSHIESNKQVEDGKTIAIDEIIKQNNNLKSQAQIYYKYIINLLQINVITLFKL